MFDRVQLEIQKRGTAETVRGGGHLLSKRVKCADCGSWYGQVTWAPHTKYEKVVWRCNKMYAKGKENCTCPAMTEEDLKAKYVIALNKLLKDKSKVLLAFDQIKEDMFRTDGLEAERDDLKNELSVVENMMEKASPADIESLEKRASLAETRIRDLNEEIRLKNLKKNDILLFMKDLAKQPIVEEFDEDLWYNLVDYMTVYTHEKVKVTFKDGTEIWA